jgi:hypothetical protein
MDRKRSYVTAATNWATGTHNPPAVLLAARVLPPTVITGAVEESDADTPAAKLMGPAELVDAPDVTSKTPPVAKGDPCVAFPARIDTAPPFTVLLMPADNAIWPPTRP